MQHSTHCAASANLAGITSLASARAAFCALHRIRPFSRCGGTAQRPRAPAHRGRAASARSGRPGDPNALHFHGQTRDAVRPVQRRALGRRTRAPHARSAPRPGARAASARWPPRCATARRAPGARRSATPSPPAAPAGEVLKCWCAGLMLCSERAIPVRERQVQHLCTPSVACMQRVGLEQTRGPGAARGGGPPGPRSWRPAPSRRQQAARRAPPRCAPSSAAGRQTLNPTTTSRPCSGARAP